MPEPPTASRDYRGNRRTNHRNAPAQHNNPLNPYVIQHGLERASAKIMRVAATKAAEPFAIGFIVLAEAVQFIAQQCESQAAQHRQ